MLYETAGAWTVSEARSALSDVIEAAATRPQRILRHGRLVAVVVGPEAYAAFEAWRDRRAGLAGALAQLHELCVEEGYELYVPERRDRATPFDAPE